VQGDIRVNILHRFVLAGLVLFMVTQVAHAALFDDEEARKRIDATNQRLSAMQRQIDDRLLLLEQQAKSGGLADLATQIQLLQGDMAKLRGQIEVVTYELEQSQKRQRDLYVDLDTRLRKMETAAASAAESANAANAANPPNTASTGTPAAGNATVVAPPAAPVAAPPTTVAVAPPVRNSTDGVAEQRAYDAALDLFKRGDYQGAITGFGTFIKTYPRSPLASSAQFWIGNAQYARRDYRGSIVTQRQLLKDYPDSSKAPDALLNIASAQADMGDNAAARRTLEELIAKYPKSDAGTRAKQRLGAR
jgi:tol-pal system protein YbgF